MIINGLNSQKIIDNRIINIFKLLFKRKLITKRYFASKTLLLQIANKNKNT